MKSVVIYIIRVYQKYLSPDQSVISRNKTICVFYPTCSEYSVQAIEKYGLIKGLSLSFYRIIKCHPLQKNHNDPLL